MGDQTMATQLIEECPLAGKTILVIEDEAFFSLCLSEAILAAGGYVAGPVASVKEGLALLKAGIDHIDAASVDIRLQDGLSFPIVERLADAGMPMLFVSGTVEELPAAFSSHPSLCKPVRAHQIIKALSHLTAF